MSDDRKAAQPPGGAALAATAPSPGPAPPPATTVDPRRLSLTVPDAAPNDLAAQANGVTGITIAAAEQHDKSPPASTLFRQSALRLGPCPRLSSPEQQRRACSQP